MLFMALFIVGFTLGVGITLYIFNPESVEETWDLQHFPQREAIVKTSTLPKSDSAFVTKVSFVT